MNCLSDWEEKASLKVREWLIIAVITGIIGGLACLTSFKGRGEARNINSLLIHQQNLGFEVLIKGAVTHPGIYHLHSEMSLRDLLAIAGVAENADLRRFSLDSIVKKGRIVNVPARVMIEVYLRGAVEGEQTLSLPKNSKLEDLITLGKFTPEADLAILKKKRKLKAGETIIIPRK